jgi:hypothetical protein
MNEVTMSPRQKIPWQKPGPLKSLALLLGAAGLLLLIVGIFSWHRAAEQRDRLKDLNLRLAAASLEGFASMEEKQLKKLADDAERLGRPLPEITYADLHRRWRSAVDRFDRVSAALGNRYLEPQAKELLQELHENLLKLRDSGEQALAADQGLSADSAWKIHNLKGSVSVLLAYSVLYYEKDGNKAAKFLTDALEDYKNAIRLVDQASRSSFERALPRWNLELITSVGEYRRIGMAEIPQANMAEVREQLQAFIPEVPGFSPGVPLETRVEK